MIMITGRRFPSGAAATVLLITVLAAALWSGCAKKPDAPAWDNPFEPSSGDPFHVRAAVSGNAVIVLWDRLDFPDIAGFEILRSLDGVDFILAGQAGATATTYTDVGFAPNHLNYYKVRVRNAAGDSSATSRVVAAQVLTLPWLEIAGGAASAWTRHVILTVRTQVGDTVEIAATPDFSGALRLAAKPGETDLIPWDLGDAAKDGETKDVWLRVFTGPVVSPVAHDSVSTIFRPDLQLANGSATVATRRLKVKLWHGSGITQLRFAPSRAELQAAAWSPPDSAADGDAYYTDDLLGIDPAPQWLFCESICNFGYGSVDSLSCVPDSLLDASFVLDRGAAMATHAVVELASSAVAKEMRFSESADLSSVPWQAYRDTTEFTLSPGGGMRVVYGQFRNDWFSAVAVDSIFYVQTGAAASR